MRNSPGVRPPSRTARAVSRRDGGGPAAERERTARELQEALTSEKELNRLKSSFVATVSHEFRTPLAVILLSSDLLERHYERLEPAQRREQLGTIAGAVRRMSALMEQVLLLSRVESGTMECKPASLELGELLSRNYAIGGAPPSWRLTAWEVREGDSHCRFWFTVQ